MEDNPDLDLDSLMELLDDNEETETEKSPIPSTNTEIPEEKSPIPPTNIPEVISNQQTSITPPNKKTKTGIALSDVDLFSTTSIDDPSSSQNSSNDPTRSGNHIPPLKSKPKQKNSPTEKVSEKDVLTKKENILKNFGELDSSDEEVEEEDREQLNALGKTVKKELQQKEMPRRNLEPRKSITTWTSKPSASNTSKSEEPSIVDSYSGIRIVNPLVSFNMLQQRMKDRRMIKMSFIQNCMKGGDIEGDWVTMGVIISKIPPKTTKNGKLFSIWKMSDLHDTESPVTVFLFGTAHTEHWKTTVGTVIGILNPSIMPQDAKKSDVCLSVDHPGKMMMMGKSKDFGFCKSKRKDGTNCNIAVNKLQCEYCSFHVKKEYKKFSANRSELQASYNGRDASLKNRLLKGSNVFYGGKSFTALEKKPTNTLKSKDKLTLSNLGLKRKATDALDNLERERGVKKLAELYGSAILPAAENNSEFINAQLAKPTVGSRNLLQHLMKEQTKKEDVTVISTKDLLKMSARGTLQQRKNDASILKSLTPQLGRGLQPGQQFSLEFSPSVVKKNSQDFAKMRAIRKIQEKGQIKAKDPNSVKVSLDSKDKVKAVLEKSLEEKKDVVEKQTSVLKSTLGTIDLNSEKVKAYLNRQSSHAYEVEMKEMEKEAAYFNRLEKKEQMEEKMAATKELVCNVVSCLKCKYTADTAAERCKTEHHPLKCHKAVKRFFACKDCKRRITAFSKFPKKACRHCHGSSFERTSMIKERTGPRLAAETLNICGEEYDWMAEKL